MQLRRRINTIVVKPVPMVILTVVVDVDIRGVVVQNKAFQCLNAPVSLAGVILLFPIG